MKVTVEIEVRENELHSIGDIQQLFQGYCDQIKTRVHTDRNGLASRLDALINTDNIDGALEELSRRLLHSGLFDDCVEVLSALLFSEMRLERGGFTHRYVTVLKRLPEQVRGRVVETIVQTALHILAAPRRLDTPRAPLLPVCETVACLVKQELLPAPNAIRACSFLLREESTRCAALTCLGKMVEFAFDCIAETCKERVLDELRSALAGVQNDCFLYDVEYIAEPFGWSAPSHRFMNIVPQGSHSHHESSILAMAVAYSTASNRELVVTSSGDGVIATWDGNGKGTLVNRVVLARHYAAALDITNRGRLLLVAGNGRDDSRPAVIMYDACWSENGAVEPDAARVITAVKSVRSGANAMQFCCALAGDEGHQIHLYDANHCTRVNRFIVHNDIITALHTPTDRDYMFLSASRDCTVAYYDLRKAAPIGQSTLHSKTITCLGMYGDYVVSGGLDRRLVVSDLRMPGQQLASREMESPILSLSVLPSGGVLPSGTAAVGTMSGLHMASLATGSVFKVDVPSTPRYNCVSWNMSGSMLFCGGDTSLLDVFSA